MRSCFTCFDSGNHFHRVKCNYLPNTILRVHGGEYDYPVRRSTINYTHGAKEPLRLNRSYPNHIKNNRDYFLFVHLSTCAVGRNEGIRQKTL